MNLDPEAAHVTALFRALRAHGPEGLGPVIVSMTRGVADLLVVYLLAAKPDFWPKRTVAWPVT